MKIWYDTQRHNCFPIFPRWQQINSDNFKINVEMLKRISNAVAKRVLTDDKPGLFAISNTGPI